MEIVKHKKLETIFSITLGTHCYKTFSGYQLTIVFLTFKADWFSGMNTLLSVLSQTGVTDLLLVC